MIAKPVKKPRIRKAPVTLREQAQQAQAKAEESKSNKTDRLRRGAKSLRIPSNPVSRALGKILRPVIRFLGWLVPKYFVNSWREVRLATWPSRQETWRLTTAVFIFAIVFGSLVAGVDKVLDIIFKKVVLK